MMELVILSEGVADWKDVLGAPMLLGFFLLVAIVAIKLLPKWLDGRKEIFMQELANKREVELAEIAVREKEAAARAASAEATGRLTETLNRTNDVTDELKIAVRTSNSNFETWTKRMNGLEEEVGRLKNAIENFQPQGASGK
ncbi:MAG TPA: hypothetical protein VN743_01620 [Blastocatellia bacterium]|nr:hypothetical protein [Blastocatellia bacterium]